MKAKNFFFSYWKSLLVVTGILYLSFAPPSTFHHYPTPRFLHADKVVHIAMYFVLTVILIFEFGKRNKAQIRARKFLFTCILFPLLFGGLIEVFQELFFKPRSAEWLDWLSDGTGVLLGFLFMWLLRKRVES